MIHNVDMTQQQLKSTQLRTTADLVLTTEELAERYQVPLATIYTWNSQGTGPRRIRVGKHVRYRMADILEWEEGNLER